MMNEYFIVPMQMDVLCLNNTLLARDGVRWWDYNYASLNRFLSPEPAAYDAAVRCTKAGAYLHFILPRALRTSLYEDGSFPLIPNRWLVTRTDQKTGASKSWVLESDCPASEQTAQQVGNSSAYPVDAAIRKSFQASKDPYRNTAFEHGGSEKEPVCYVNIGIAFPLENWEERESDIMFLTAMSQGNEKFTAYYPHNKQVLSFCDLLDGIDSATLNYSVIGWYSDKSMDVIRPGAYVRADNIGEVWNQLGWNADKMPNGEANSLFCAQVENVLWDRMGEVPKSDPLTELEQSRAINLAIGDQSLDALAALVSIRLSDREDRQQIVEFLEALYLDKTELLDHPAGERLLKDCLSANGFERSRGDLLFKLAKEGKEGHEASLTESELDFLKDLNKTQREYEHTLREFRSLQWEANAAWWKHGRLSNLKINHTGIRKEEIAPLLDPVKEDGLMHKALALLERLNHLSTRLPVFSEDSSAQRRNFEEFLNRSGIYGCLLKSESVNDFYLAENPALLINGLSPSPDMELAEELSIHHLMSLQATLRLPSSEQRQKNRLPDGVQVAADCMKADSELYSTHWAQPFALVFFEWNMQYSHIPWNLDGKDNWYFDGDDYQLREDYRKKEGTSSTYGGIASLSPHINAIMQERLRKLKLEKGHSEKIDQWLSEVSHWNFMTQELSGLREQLAQRDERAFRCPVEETFRTEDEKEHSFRTLLGYPSFKGMKNSGLKLPESAVGTVNSVPFARNDVISPYFGIRSGVVAFKDIMLYDKFGRVLNLIDSRDGAGVNLADNFPFILSDRLVAVSSENKRLATRMVLPPRLLQSARIKLGENQCAELCGWLVINYINRSVAIYDEDGFALGELLLLASSGEKRVRFRQYPETQRTNRELINPTLKSIVNALESLRPNEWNQFTGTLEKTVCVFPPSSFKGLSFMTGRLLAVTKIDLTLELLGKPFTDQAWDKTVKRPLPNYLDFEFSVRLGEAALPEDGLVGYFAEGDYTTFHSSICPAEGADYVRQIGPKGRVDGNYIKLSIGKKKTVVMIMEPDLQVHVYSGILPVAKMGILKRDYPQKEAFLSIGPIRMAENNLAVSGGISEFMEKMGKQHVASWWEKDMEEAYYERDVEEMLEQDMKWSVREGILSVRKGGKIDE